MKVALARAFPLAVPAERAWALLQRLEEVATCMPGATITQMLDERHCKGTVTVRVGPATMSFRGEVEVDRIDAGERSLHLLGRGTDTTGSSGATLDLVARIEDAGADGARLVGTGEASVSGKAAAFGARMMDAVAEQVLRQFAANFATRAAQPAAGGGPPGSPAGAAAAAPAGAPQGNELNGLALLWAVLRQWLRARLGRGPA